MKVNGNIKPASIIYLQTTNSGGSRSSYRRGRQPWKNWVHGGAHLSPLLFPPSYLTDLADGNTCHSLLSEMSISTLMGTNGHMYVPEIRPNISFWPQIYHWTNSSESDSFPRFGSGVVYHLICQLHYVLYRESIIVLDIQRYLQMVESRCPSPLGVALIINHCAWMWIHKALKPKWPSCD